MKININEITIKINLIPEEKKPHPNFLANAFVTFKDDVGNYITISGFAVWKSKDYEGYNVTVPQRPGTKHRFQYWASNKDFGTKIKREIISEYHNSTIPTIEEKT
jgi:hypothetical protein